MKIPVDQIEIIDASFGPEQEETLVALTDSIKEQGLSHPIIVRPPNDSGKYQLASGEKRLLAARRLEWTHIEAEVRDIDEKKGKEIRIHENLKRFNLPWWEQVKLTESLHLLRQEEYGVAQRGRPARNEEKQGWSIRDTAEELGVGIGPLSEDLSLARALRNDATLAKVTDKKTAIKLVRNAAARHEAEMTAGLPSKIDYNQVLFGDSAELLKHLPPQSIDHAILDPPWIKFFEASLRIDERTLPVFRELHRVLKTGAMLYVFAGLDDYAYYAGVTVPDIEHPGEVIHMPGKLETLGFNVSNTPLIWQKENSLSRRGVRAWEYDRDFEFIVVAAKGSPTLTSSTRFSGIKKYPIVPPMKMIHPNEKPVDLIKDIISDCSYPGNIIIDTFGGSGVLGQACKEMDRRFLLMERDRNSYEKIVKRLEEKND